MKVRIGESKLLRRRRDTEELRQLCDTISEAYRDRDLFDFASRTDMAVSRLLKHVGIDGMPKADGQRPAGGEHTANGVQPPRP